MNDLELIPTEDLIQEIHARTEACIITYLIKDKITDMEAPVFHYSGGYSALGLITYTQEKFKRIMFGDD
jgi:hypothetical protein